MERKNRFNSVPDKVKLTWKQYNWCVVSMGVVVLLFLALFFSNLIGLGSIVTTPADLIGVGFMLTIIFLLGFIWMSIESIGWILVHLKDLKKYELQRKYSKEISDMQERDELYAERIKLKKKIAKPLMINKIKKISKQK